MTFLMVCSRRREARELGKIEKNESRFAMDRLSSMDDVMLNAIFRHFAHPYVPTMPMVGTCRKVFLTWRNRRRLLALDTLKSLTEHLTFLDRTAVALGDRQGGVVEVRELFPELAELRDLVK